MNRYLQITFLLLVGANISCSGCDTEAYVVRSPPLLVKGTALLDFGALPLDFQAIRQIQLANAGQQELVFDSIIIESHDNAFVLSPFETSIRGGQSVDLVIGFTPTEEKVYEGTIKLVSNNDTKPETTISLLGQGLANVICGDCNNPPEDECVDEDTLAVYVQNGECVDGICRYTPSYIDCPYGCENAACLPAPDGGVVEAEVWDSGQMEGINDAGQPPAVLDAGSSSEPPEPSVQMMKMALSELGSCGILKEPMGQVACWGRGDTLGDGSSIGLARSVPGVIPDFEEVTDIAAGAYHMCAIKSDQSLWCWGSNIYGEVGDGTTITRTSPTRVNALADPVLFVAAGRMFTCAVTQASDADAEVYCWGKGNVGQLGNGLILDVTVPQKVIGLEDGGVIDGIYVGDTHACVEMDDTKLYCWGGNSSGQCLVAGGANQSSAIEILGDYGVGTIQQVALGHGHACVLLGDNKIICWGSDGFGQMDDGIPGGNNYFSPVTPVGLLPFVSTGIASGGHHICVLKNDAGISCWGLNNNGACGSGAENLQVSQTVLPLHNPNNILWERIYAGKDHTCALDKDYYAYCWGFNSFGQIGNNSDDSPIPSPVPVTW